MSREVDTQTLESCEMMSRCGSRAVIHIHGWHGHVCCALRTGHSSHTFQTRSSGQSLCVFLESVCCWCHAACIRPVLIVRAWATVPKCHHSLSQLNPSVLPIHSSLSRVSTIFRLSPRGRTRMPLTAELEKIPRRASARTEQSLFLETAAVR